MTHITMDKNKIDSILNNLNKAINIIPVYELPSYENLRIQDILSIYKFNSKILHTGNINKPVNTCSLYDGIHLKHLDMLSNIYCKDFNDLDLISESKSTQPYSYKDFIARLHTFSSTYLWFAKPDCIDAIECARNGWCCNAVDTLICYNCNQTLKHEKNDKDGLILSTKLSDGHSNKCLWKDYSSPKEFYYLPKLSEDQLNVRLTSSILSFLKSFKVAFSKTKLDNNKLNDQALIQLDQKFVSSINLDYANDIIKLNFVDLSIVLLNNFNKLENELVKIQTNENYRIEIFSNHINKIISHLLSKLDDSSSISDEVRSKLSVLLNTISYLCFTGWMTNSSNSNLCLHCDLCSRKIILNSKTFINKPFDSLREHRSYCPWVNKRSNGLSNWYFINYKYLNESSNIKDHKREAINESPGNLYKRVKLALNEAVNLKDFK